MCESQYSCHSLENKHSQNVTDMEAGFYQGRKEGKRKKHFKKNLHNYKLDLDQENVLSLPHFSSFMFLIKINSPKSF